MSTRTHEGYILEEGLSRIDWSRVHAWLTASYWSPGIAREQVERAARHSALVLAAFSGHEQVGYLRVVSDNTRFAYICDVWVDAAHRRRGLARAMVQYAMEHPDFSTVGWLLATAGKQEPVGIRRDAVGVIQSCQSLLHFRCMKITGRIHVQRIEKVFLHIVFKALA